MCGILGTVASGIKRDQFERALAMLHHRGPFGSGSDKFGRNWMGMTRLPMSSNEPFALPPHLGHFVTSFNGEIYRPKGLNLQTEIGLLLAGISTRVFPDGMYALAAYDTDSQALYLVRDQLGIKPLYYYLDQGRSELYYASEIAPLIDLLGSVELDREILAEQMICGVSLDYRTPFKGIRLVEPGTMMRFDLMKPDDITVSTTSIQSDVHIIGETIEERLGNSIQQCLHGFRETGLLVSGGLDSNLINSFLPPVIRKFHVAVEHGDDSPPALQNMTVSHLVESNFWAALTEAVGHFGMPTRMSSIAMYQQLANSIAGNCFHCVLLGEGADEVFWGYPRHLDLFRNGFSLDVDSLLRMYFGNMKEVLNWLPAEVSRRVREKASAIASKACSLGADGALHQFDRNYSLEPLLRRADHILMSRTIEARLPYLHNGLPDLGQAFGRRNLGDGRQKAILMDLAASRIPGYVTGQKQHFRVPFSKWPMVAESMRQFLCAHSEILASLGMQGIDSESISRFELAHIFTLATVVIWWQHYGEKIR